MSKWISVEQQRPPTGSNNMLLFYNGKHEVTYGYAYDDKGFERSERIVWISDCDRQTNEVATHWMPLPQPPKDDV